MVAFGAVIMTAEFILLMSYIKKGKTK